jgi:predicted metal-dependent hydrolase
VLDFISKLMGEAESDYLLVRGRQVRLVTVRSERARRYHLRLRPDGSARLTIPRRGSVAEGRRFAERSGEWLARQLEKLSRRPVRPQSWRIGTTVLFRGQLVTLEAGIEDGMVRLGGESIRITGAGENLRPWITKHLWKLAATELPERTHELAAVHQLTVARVTVRNQRSRWGSCSRRGTISLNWRLIQTPPFIRDYIILHELMHLREMNHSSRFWREVERVCPGYAVAEKWLKQNSGLLGPNG